MTWEEVPMYELIFFAVFVIIMIAAWLLVKKTPYEQGEEAYLDGIKEHTNPYSLLSQRTKHVEWNKGYNDARHIKEQQAKKYWSEQ